MKAKLFKKGEEDYILLLNNPKEYPFPLPLLSLKNCQAIELGYDLDELAKTIFPDKIFTTNEEYEIPIDGFPYQWGFKVGFQKALELMGDKKFSEADIHEAYFLGEREDRDGFHNLLQPLQQTEWDVEVEMEKVIDETKIIGAVKGVKGSGSKITTYKSVPKLDEDGCLILKRL